MFNPFKKRPKVTIEVRDAKIIPQEGDKEYIELNDGLRLIFVHGKYVGFYTQEPKV